ncbi:nucleotide disphospho-sugar-binding domain-containing protein [Actinosynnema sp. NPDC023587]|uniref:nucleotide disphospho-sugar-binding domain-containing protein n=1 Tax=Actinosynnema sp. NPDC023587 TaxID=3154695 RepID=UPI0033E85BFE
MRVLFTTVALPGHFFPLVPLAWACQALGYEVLVVTSDHFADSVVRSGLPVATSGTAPRFVDLAPTPRADGPSERVRLSHGRAFGALADHALAGTSSLVASWRPDVVVAERAEFAGPLAAADHDVPAVEYHWGAATLAEYRSGAEEALAATLERRGLTGLPDPALVLNPWPRSLHLPEMAHHRSARYVPYNGDARLPAWLFRPRSAPRVIITLGTLLPQFGPNGVREVVLPLLEQVARHGVDIVVAVDDAVAADWPALPAQVSHVGRLPMAQVLQACDALVHHGGQGTALTGLHAGKPQLVLPHIDDQWGNADAVVRSGSGLSFAPHEAGPDAIAERCVELVRTPAYTSAALDVAAEMAGQPGLTEVVESLEKLV